MKLLTIRMLLATAGASLAALGTAQTYTVLDLNPPGSTDSGAMGISNGVIVGYSNPGGFGVEATRWDLSGNMSLVALGARALGVNATTIVGTDETLNRATVWPVGGGAGTTLGSAGLSAGYAISGNIAVGAADVGSGNTGAAYWDLSDPLTAIPLAGDFSVANAIDGSRIVGVKELSRATIWDISPAPAVDLQRDDLWGFSTATGISGTTQVGWAQTLAGPIHAVAWSGSAASAVDLHIAGEANTFAQAISGDTIVGFIDNGDSTQEAVAWIGPTRTVVNLHALLGADYVSSNAYGVDAQGNIVGLARTTGGENHAVVWKKAQYTFGNFHHPLIDPDDQQIASFKKRSVIPVIIQIFDAQGAVAPNLDLQISVTQGSGAGLEEIPVDDFDTAFDVGDRFFYVFGYYVYFMSTRDLDRGIYTVHAKIVTTGQTHSVDFRIR